MFIKYKIQVLIDIFCTQANIFDMFLVNRSGKNESMTLTFIWKQL